MQTQQFFKVAHTRKNLNFDTCLTGLVATKIPTFFKYKYCSHLSRAKYNILVYNS